MLYAKSLGSIDAYLQNSTEIIRKVTRIGHYVERKFAGVIRNPHTEAIIGSAITGIPLFLEVLKVPYNDGYIPLALSVGILLVDHATNRMK